LDPVDRATGRNQLGKRELRKGELSFFLRPGERLESGIQNVYILGSEEGLLLRSRETFVDNTDPKKPIKHLPGDRWMIYGPTDYVPQLKLKLLKEERPSLSMKMKVYMLEISNPVKLELLLEHHTC
jgi:major vault protein